MAFATSQRVPRTRAAAITTFTFRRHLTPVAATRAHPQPAGQHAHAPLRYRIGSGCAETGIPCNNRPAPTTAALDNKGSVGVNTWVEYNLTSASITANGTYAFVVAADSSDGVAF